MHSGNTFSFFRFDATRLFTVLIVLLLLFSSAFPFGQYGNVYAGDTAQSEPATVRVGYFYNGDFMHKDDDGSYSGYDIEYYYKIAGYADWKIEMVEFNSLNDALAALKSGEIDILSGLSKTPERESSYLVSNLKMCTSHIAVQTRADDDRFSAGEPETMTDLTCGILKASNVVKLYADWCGQNGLTPHIVEFDSIQQRNEAFAQGEVDAIAAGSTIAGAQKIAEFPSLDLFFMLNPAQGELKAQLDRAMGIISLADPTYSTDIFNKYFPSTRNSEPSFSRTEKTFIAAHPVLKVAVLEDDAPFSSIGTDGTITGILPEYFRHLSQVVGTSFECVAYASKDEACAALSAGDVDLIGKFENNIFDANARDEILTQSYLDMDMVQLTRSGTGSVTIAAVPECNASAVKSTMSAMKSTIEVKTFPNSDECFTALKNRTVNAVICTQPAASWLLLRNRTSEYVALAFGNSGWDSSCAIRSSADGNTLRSILDKTIAVDNGYINQIITNITLDESADVSSVLNHMPVSYIAAFAITAALLFIIVFIALMIIIRRRRIEKQLAEKQADLHAAEQANKARHAFFGTVSHDMRTPLNGIMGFTDLAEKCGDMEEIKTYLAKIRMSGSILSNLVSDTLILSRMENGKYSINPSPSDLCELTVEVIEPIRGLAAENHVIFKDNSAEIPHRIVMTDRLSVQKIMLNLLSNAMKFTPEGGIVTFIYSRDGSNTVFSVSDTGVGISEEFMPHIFEAFSQEDPANTGAAGSGLGLSIVRSIIDAMGGSVSVTSRKGSGTTFTVALPLEDAPAAGQPVREAEKPDVSRLAGRRVLICEDNKMNLEIVTSILENAGMEVTGAENGKVGVEVCREKGIGYFDVILLDLRMPVMDGLTAARTIRAMSGADERQVPILAISADAFPENVEECMAAGMNAHIAKPINSDDLLRTILQYVN